MVKSIVAAEGFFEVRERPTVNGLPLPELLVSLIEQRKWTHPGDARLQELIPFLLDEVDFLESPEAMAFESSGFLADDPELSAIFHEVRGEPFGCAR